jgi:hypothetical protein
MAAALSYVLLVVYMIGFIYGVVMIIEAGWKLKSGNPAEAQEGIVAVMLLASGPIIIETLFNIFGLPGAFSL